jgi:4-carboxymuconolactone decarboxylase
MPAPAASSLSDDQKRALSDFAEARGYTARGPFIPLLRSPRLLTATRAMGDYLRFHIPLRPSLRELAILLSARKWSQPFEWNSHYAIALEHGLSAEVADAIGKGRRPDVLSADEEIIYNFCTELLEYCGVGDETYDLAKSRFGEAVIVDIVGLVGYYTFLAMMLNVARTPVPPDAAHPLPPREST